MSQRSKDNTEHSLLLVYDYFDPAFLAGGPISSCANLVRSLEDKLRLDIFSSNKDLDGTRLEVEADEWISYGASSICYGDRCWSFRGMYRVLRQRKPDVLYLNGIYSLKGVLFPVLLAYVKAFRGRVVISPRGMLLPQSLALKPTKKKLYLAFFKRLVSGAHVTWHVTSREEQLELVCIIPSASCRNIQMIGNVPRTDLELRVPHVKSPVVRFLTIALISPMKNILKVVEALKQVQSRVIYDIYGPVKDSAYWKQCLEAIDELPDHITVKHHGVLSRKEIQCTLEKYDFFIQPSRSENFGHAIFESLLVGVPVITSDKTPWSSIAEENAGFVVNPEKDGELLSAINQAVVMPQHEYESNCRNARSVAEAYLRNENFESKYLELFAGFA